jgi:hypothetical protein
MFNKEGTAFGKGQERERERERERKGGLYKDSRFKNCFKTREREKELNECPFSSLSVLRGGVIDVTVCTGNLYFETCCYSR